MPILYRHAPRADPVPGRSALGQYGAQQCANVPQVLKLDVVRRDQPGPAMCSRRESRPGSPAYDAAKAGVDALTRYFCAEYGHLGVRCNAVAPGAVDTDMTRSLEGSAAAREQTLRLSPMRRVSSAQEVAEVVAFLLSPASQPVNGHVLVADNGLLSRGHALEAIATRSETAK